MNALDAKIKKLRKSYGECSIMDLRKNEVFHNIERVQLDSPKIGDLFGMGGVAKGRIIEIYGPESGGKTSLSTHVGGVFQKCKFTCKDYDGNDVPEHDGTVLFIDAENSFDAEYAKVHDFDIKKCILIQPNDAEEATQIAIELVKTGLIDLVVIDSIAALTPRAELEADMDAQQMGLQARIISKFLRKITTILSKTDTTMICINQIRMKIGVTYGNPECVAPDTLVEIQNMKISVESLFNKAGYDYKDFSINEVKDISDKNILIKSLNIRTGEPEFRRVNKLVRKKNTKVYKIYDSDKKLLFKASPGHRLYCKIDNEWIWEQLENLPKEFISLNDKGNECLLNYDITNDEYPILDFEVDENHNYFANGILSHNTTPAGKALKFYSSIRIEVRKREYIKDKDKPIGLRINAKSIKNKTAPPMKRHELNMYFDRGFDSRSEWLDFAIQYDVVQRPTVVTYISVNGTKVKSRSGIEAYYADPENAKEYDELIRLTKERMYFSTKPMRVSVDKKEDEKEIKELEEKSKLQIDDMTISKDGEIIEEEE